MRATIEDCDQEIAESSSLEAEAAAWRRKRSTRPVSIAGKVSVVRIRRRARLKSWSASSADCPLPAVPR